MRRIGLVGAGFISRVHAEALRGQPGIQISAIVDPAPEAAQALARTLPQLGPQHCFVSVEDALAADAFDCAHVMVPPHRHADAALPILKAGKPVFLEKPLGVSVEECRALVEAGEANGAPLGTNQNFVFHPAFAALRKAIEKRQLGRPSFIDCIYNMPLRQLAARQFGHWMFQAPGNLLLEQAVHPLSQIALLAGEVQDAQGYAGAPLEIAPGRSLFPSLSVSLRCRRLPAQLRFSVGQSFPFWQISVICDDGVIVADIINNRCFTHARTRWLEAVDGVASGSRTGLSILTSGWRNGVDYAASTLRVKKRSDAFFQSMAGSIAAFHGALDKGAKPAIDGRFGGALVEACELILDRILPAEAPIPEAPLPLRSEAREAEADVAVLGGTGFIGTQVVKRLLADGLRVSVMARSVSNLSPVFLDERVSLHRGSIRDRAAVERAIGAAPIVVNLAHGGGSGSFENIRDAMVGGARMVAEVCLARNVTRLIHVGSIASLYLGPQAAKVTGGTPPDPKHDQRSDYARAKALCDIALLEMHAKQGLPVCILRPGVVVGEGGPAFHTGLGFYNNEQHCLGWNAGTNLLPFVLVEDVADAVAHAVRAERIEGRCYNLVGDVRLSAREYTEALAWALQRPLRFHPQSPRKLWLTELGKWTIKRATGKKVPAPTLHDIHSRGLSAEFDCSDAKADLAWRPEADREQFLSRAILVHTASHESD